MKAPCKNCVRRTAECHAECREYREFQKENEKIKKNRKNVPSIVLPFSEQSITISC